MYPAAVPTCSFGHGVHWCPGRSTACALALHHLLLADFPSRRWGLLLLLAANKRLGTVCSTVSPRFYALTLLSTPPFLLSTAFITWCPLQARRSSPGRAVYLVRSSRSHGQSFRKCSTWASSVRQIPLGPCPCTLFPRPTAAGALAGITGLSIW